MSLTVERGTSGSPSGGASANGRRIHAIRPRARTITTLILVTLISLVAFGWPLIAAPGSDAVAHSGDAPWVFALLLPLLIALVWAELGDGGVDAKALAVLGVLAAVGTALRPLGGGIAGLEPVWVLIILGGRALGPAFGFTLGSVTLISSALITGGVGPWLPFQMIAAGWVGLGAGLLPRTTPKNTPGAATNTSAGLLPRARSRSRAQRTEIVMLCAYAFVACIAYGFCMNLWFWPFSGGLAPQLAYVPGAPLLDNLQHWLVFGAATSLGYDIPRAILTVVLIALAGGPILAALRRSTRRASFGAVGRFEDAA
ncbi:MAG: ECF transporter S component [Actinobacteria bacterium]|nr:ECF transporter S component [Actinomycetota bacterium]